MKNVTSNKEKFHKSSTKIVIVGIFFVISGILGIFLFMEGESIYHNNSISFVKFIQICGPPLANIFIGLLFLAGGYGCIKYKEWGRITVVVILFILLAYCFGYALYFLISILQESGLTMNSLIMSTMALMITAFWIYILLIPYRYFKSNDVRTICN